MPASTEHDQFRDRCLMHLCHALERLGEYDEGVSRGLEVLERAVVTEDRELEAWIRLTLGMLYGRTGQVELQRANHDAALELIDALGNERATAMFLLNIGVTHREGGRPAAAVPQLRRCLELYQRSGSVSGEAEALDELGLVYVQLGDPEQALEYQRRGLTLAQQAEVLIRQASIRHRMGLALLASGRPDEAAAEWDVALEIYRRHGSPAADEVRRLLDGEVSSPQR
jgi:tetratricopeptide (TPR) repeat protein